MHVQTIRTAALSLAASICFTQLAHADILAQDDFSGPGSGTGWQAGNDWEGLAGGVVSTAGGVQSFRNFATPLDATNQVTYIRFDFAETSPGTGSVWGGTAFFEGVEGAAAAETFFAGDPSQFPNYGLDLKQGDTLNSGVPINNQFHTIIVAIDTTGPGPTDAAYRLWVDNFNVNTPTATATITNSPIDAPWGVLRLASDGSVTQQFDNLTIATTAAEVGLVPEPSSLAIFGLLGLAMPGLLRRRCARG